MRILLIGGSKSGKSHFAQTLCLQLAKNRSLYYWAAMEPTDEEDHVRIARHLCDRDGMGFRTIECGRKLNNVLPSLLPEGTILFDSITALLANEMFGDSIDAHAPQRVLQELLTVSQHCAHFLCVCDDIWRDGTSYSALTQQYCRGLAQICRALASEFDTVCEISAGIPFCRKGELPL